MADNKVHSKSEEEEVVIDDSQDNSDDLNNSMVPKSRLDKVIEQREKAIEELSTYKEKAEEIDSLKRELEELKQSVIKKPVEPNDVFTREEEEALSKIDKGLRGKGFLTQEQFDEWQRVERRNNEVNRLSDKYKKGSGYPEFKADEVMVYAKQKSFGENLEAAYRDLHWEAITQVISSKKDIEVPESEKPSGGDRVKGTQVSTTDIAKMSDQEYEQNRGDIMTKFKNAIFGR